MSTIEIAKDAIPWDAIATACTGVLAVGAAVWVGIRQTRIAQLQVEIVDRQVGLQEMSLRGDLFDRRFAVYESTQKLLSEIIAKAAPPSQATERDFLIGLDKAKFLFATSTHESMKEIWANACKFGAIKSVMNHNFQTTGQYGPDEIQQENDLLLWFYERLNELSETFGKDLRLSSKAP